MWLIVLCAVLATALAVCMSKLVSMRRALDELEFELESKLTEDTNTKITLSSGDRRVRLLAAFLNRRLRTLRELRLRYERGDCELREALTGISHDLRTPLTAICGYTELLKRQDADGGYDSEKVREYAAIIEGRANYMKGLTDELLRYSIAVSGIGGTELTDVVINGVLEESILAYYAALREREIEPSIEIPEVRVCRKLDRESLARIFENVLGNAIKYSGGDLYVSLSEEAEIVFSNTAPKLTGAAAGRLFDRYFTVEDANKSTGLGLAIAKTLTERMGGEIDASYSDGRLQIRIKFPENGQMHDALPQ